jgi:hypothetical protein
MGMFDYLRCHYPHPGLDMNAHYQTKDLSCTLDTYEITPDGRLIGPHGNEDCQFRGALQFYTSTGRHATNDFRWYEYSALFDEGRLINMKTIDDGSKIRE